LLVPGLPIAWILLRGLFDTRECRFGAALKSAGLLSYAVSLCVYLGLAPIADSQVQTLTAGVALMAGHWFVLAAVVSYSRFVVLDAQGLIAVPQRKTQKKVAKSPAAKTASRPATDLPAVKSATTLSATGYSRATIQPAKTPADSSRWVDGSRPERDHRYDNDEEDDDDSSEGGRKLSKADRKRLRKMKTEGRAA
jgi:hypothetical protein